MKRQAIATRPSYFKPQVNLYKRHLNKTLFNLATRVERNTEKSNKMDEPLEQLPNFDQNFRHNSVADDADISFSRCTEYTERADMEANLPVS